MQFIEIAPNFYLNSAQVVHFKLLHSPQRGGYVWVFSLTGGKVLFSIPFKSEEEARRWLEQNLNGLQHMQEDIRETHRGYKAE